MVSYQAAHLHEALEEQAVRDYSIVLLVQIVRMLAVAVVLRLREVTALKVELAVQE
jgi:hypothetical protein